MIGTVTLTRFEPAFATVGMMLVDPAHGGRVHGRTLMRHVLGVAGGVTVAVLRKLVDSGRIDPDAETVVFNTADGLKTLDAIADRVSPAATIDPSYAAFTATGL